MSTPLISDSELNALREVGLMGMQTSVMILARSTITTDDGQQDFWPPTGPTVMGWVYSTPTPLIVVNAGEQATINTYRLYVPVGTDIQPGYHVIISGNPFTVSDTTEESTWLPLLNCSLRRLE